MKKIQIKSKKQDNGLWGMPLSCTRLTNIPILDDDKNIKFSAISCAISEQYNDTTFDIFYVNMNGFIIKINNYNNSDKLTIFSIKYENYEVDDNILYEFENDNDRKIFFRNKKLNKLNEK